MKKLLLTAIISFACLSSFSQKVLVKPDAKGNLFAYKDSTNKDSLTGQMYTDIKGVVYPVYKSRNDKLYIMRFSEKKGVSYKQYLKIEAQ